MKRTTLRKIVGAGIVLCFLLAGSLSLSATSLTNNNAVETTSPPEPLVDYTHTVLVEACTASWCPPCATAAYYIHNIYNSGNYDFSYVALVADKNGYANQRCGELGVTNIPDYVFDGGYTRWVGSNGLPGAYTTRLDLCGQRDVADVDLNLNVQWLGDAELGINLEVTNNEADGYTGHVHVYVTEIESRWDTYNGQPYHFAMIGNYGINQYIDVPTGGQISLEASWDGDLYGVGDIERDNIMVIATVYDSSTMDTDETIAVMPVIPGDINADGVVNVEDLLLLLAAWGNPGGPEDVNGDGVVNVEDLLILLANWG
jgi:hypothetical protein